MIALRDYQQKLVTDIRTAFATYRRVLAVSPTGSGKTRCFVYIATSAAAKGKRIVILGHRTEIVEQISSALDDMGVRHGRIAPGHTMTTDPVQVAMVQTLGRRIARVPPPDLLVIDEAHHGVAGSWATVAEAWPTARILGVTATPQRLDGRGLGAAFDEMILGPSMRELIEAGYLADYDYLAPPERADLTGIRTRAGDYAIDDLAAAMDRAVVTGDAVEHYRKYLDGKPAIAFCVTVAHAEHVSEQFRAAGFRAQSVDGSMARADRRERITAIGNGGLNVLTSCDIISEGTDIPAVAGAILLRPTQSLSLFLQQVGRCLRPNVDGSKAKILDHVGNVHRHGMPDTPREWSLDAKRKKRTPSAPTATCEQCFRVFAVRPNWKAEAECNDGLLVGCILNTAPDPKDLPKQVDGELVAFDGTRPWSNGISLSSARGREWFKLLALADTREKLDEIARVRNYKKGWAHYIMRERAGSRVAA